MKTAVYSWRLSEELKAELEREARHRRVSLSSLLDLAAREWLRKSGEDVAGDEAQRKLHAAVEECIGVLASNNPHLSETVRETVRKRLGKRFHGR
jgi:hypothetical protein